MNNDFTFAIKSIRFDENYQPSDSTRITTNFANLARGSSRQDNLRNALRMIDNRFNALAHWDNPTGDRYCVELEIISVDMDIQGSGEAFPSIEVLKTNIVDRKTNERIEGIVGNNFSLMCVTMTLVFYCWTTIKTSRNSVSQQVLVNCMASCLKPL